MCNGKGVRDLIEWLFDEELADTREEIARFNITEQEIKEDGVERRVKAYYPPKATELAYRIFSFLRDNEQNVNVAGGMQHFILSMNRNGLKDLCPSYGLEFSSILPFIQLYEMKLLERQSNRMKGSV